MERSLNSSKVRKLVTVSRIRFLVIALIIIGIAGGAYLYLRPNVFYAQRLSLNITVPRGWDLRDQQIPDLMITVFPVAEQYSSLSPSLVIKEISDEDFEGFVGDFNLATLYTFMENRLINEGLQINDSGETELDGYDAYFIDFEGTIGEIKPRELNIFYFVANRGYVVQYAATSLSYDEQLADIQEIINTIELPERSDLNPQGI